MFEFLKNIASKAGGKPEAQRARVVRALGEINSVLAELDVKPKLSFDPSTGALELELPEQMPDERLALPAPEADLSEDKEAA